MKKLAAFLVILAFLVQIGISQDLTSKFDADKMRERVKRLSADDFEGRGPGTAGGKRAAQYLADQLKSIGATPANRGSYFQNVPLVGVKADRGTKLRVGKTGETAGKTYEFG